MKKKLQKMKVSQLNREQLLREIVSQRQGMYDRKLALYSKSDAISEDEVALSAIELLMAQLELADK